MKVCYFGTYDKNYSRNRVIIKGLRKNNIKVIECNDDPWKVENKIGMSNTKKIGIIISFLCVYFKIIIQYFRYRPYDAIIVGYLGHFDVFPAKILSIIDGKPLVFDAFYSLYDTLVNDRKIMNKNSLLTKSIRLAEKISYKLSDLILFDTPSHITYCSKEFKIKEKKFDFLPVGSDEEIFYPRKIKKERKFTIIFWGKFIPLQGIEYIVDAAKILSKENLRFLIIGKGQTYEKIMDIVKKFEVKNIDFIDFIPYEELPLQASKAHVGLGIFGNTEKAKRVVPNKVYEILALGMPLITGNSKAVSDLGLIDKENCILCEMSSSKSIANSILNLKRNKKLREKIAKNGYRLFINNFSTEKIGKKMKDILEKI